MKKWLFLLSMFLVALNFSFVGQPEAVGDKCSDCHSSLLENRFIHMPAREDCASCHSANGNEHPNDASHGFTLTSELPALCFSCHDMGIEKKKITHEPVSEGNCQVCHDPHSSANTALLVSSFPAATYVTATRDSFALCFTCHDAALFENPVTPSETGFRNGDKNMHFLHVNGQKGRNCTFCHDIHGSDNDHLILENVRFGSWNMPMKYKVLENGGSCAPGCHAEKIYKR